MGRSTHVERAAENRGVLAETVNLWRGNIAAGKGAQNTVFALNLMGGLGQQLSGWLLAQNVLCSRGGGKEVGRVRLAVAELLRGKRELDVGDSGAEVVLQRGKTDRVADGAGHGE